MSEGKKQTTNRFMALEGVRGIAATMVVVFHMVYMYWMVAVTGHGIQHYKLEDNLYGNPLFVFVSGGFAVSIFFILSGFVLSIGFFKKGSESSVRSQVARRYLRLMLPAAVACMMAFTLLKLGLNFNPASYAYSHSAMTHRDWSMIPNFWEALYNGAVGIFVDSKYDNYLPVLWTMHWEFFGSLLVFGFLLLIGKQSKRWIGYLILSLLLYKSQLFGFLLGMAIADIYSRGILKDISLRLGIPVLIVGLYLGGVPANIGAHETFYSFIPRFIDITDGQWVWLLRTLAAAIIILVVLITPYFKKALEKRFVSTLGKYTFALYLTHLLVLYTFTGWLFIKLYPILGYNHSATIAFISSIPLIVCLTVLFERYIDQPSIVLARRFSDWFISEESESLVQIFHRQRYALASRLYAVEAKYRYATESVD